MIPRFIRIQLVILLVATVIGTAVLGIVYVQVPQLLGVGRIAVTAELTDAARLYPRAEVTYRGRPVGLVQDIRLIPGGVAVDMSIDRDADVPAATTAAVHSISAVGEQYVDLVPPAGATGPSIEDGAVIPRERTSVPTQIGPTLDAVNTLVASLPPDDLNTVLRETHSAVDGVGDDLQRLLDDGTRLTDTAQQNFPQTEQLIRELGPLLDTQTENSGPIRALSRDLADLSDQLVASDGDIRAILDTGRPFSRELTGLLDDVRPTLPVLLGNIVTVGDVLVTYNANLETILVAYPLVNAAAQGAVRPTGPDHMVQVDIAATTNDPPACLQGFVPAERWRDPADTSVAAPEDVHCKLPADDPSVARGVRNTPCQEGVPGRRAASPEECRGEQEPTVAAPNNPPFPPGSTLGGLSAAGARVLAVPYDPLSGRAIGPDGKPFFLRGVGSTTQPGKESTWRDLLLAPIGA